MTPTIETILNVIEDLNIEFYQDGILPIDISPYTFHSDGTSYEILVFDRVVYQSSNKDRELNDFGTDYKVCLVDHIKEKAYEVMKNIKDAIQHRLES